MKTALLYVKSIKTYIGESKHFSHKTFQIIIKKLKQILSYDFKLEYLLFNIFHSITPEPLCLFQLAAVFKFCGIILIRSICYMPFTVCFSVREHIYLLEICLPSCVMYPK